MITLYIRTAGGKRSPDKQSQEKQKDGKKGNVARSVENGVRLSVGPGGRVY